MQKIEKIKRQNESGNVLFLILIAVALFAALSYAVTQSSRSGSGDASSETNLINSSTITQYPAGVRTAMVRMVVSGGLTADDFEFNSPSDFAAGTAGNEVFNPGGGGSTYQAAGPDLMVGGAPGRWYFNANFEVPLIGTTTGTGTGNDIIAFLPGVKKAVCQKLNDEYGITGIPVHDATTGTLKDDKLNGEPVPGVSEVLGTAGNLDGHPFGCFEDADDGYVYYHVLMER